MKIILIWEKKLQKMDINAFRETMSWVVHYQMHWVFFLSEHQQVWQCISKKYTGQHCRINSTNHSISYGHGCVEPKPLSQDIMWATGDTLEMLYFNSFCSNYLLNSSIIKSSSNINLVKNTLYIGHKYI